MKKKIHRVLKIFILVIILSVIIVFIFVFLKQKENDMLFVLYKWDLINYSCNIINNEEQEISLKLKYLIKNNTNKEIWFYDMQQGNDMQYTEFEITENIVRKTTYIYKPYEKSNNGWYGSWGYNPVFPNSFLIEPNKTRTDEIYISYIIDKNLVAEELLYRFNFIILDVDLSKNFNKLSNSYINEKHSRNYFVEIRIMAESQGKKNTDTIREETRSVN
jgi:hypothetical protein